MNKNLKIEVSAVIVLIGFFTAVVFHYIMNFYYHAPYPLNTFLVLDMHIKSQFSDFFSDYYSAEYLSPYTSSLSSAYFPAAYLLLYPFTLLPMESGAIFYSLFFAAVIAGLCTYYLRRESHNNFYMNTHPAEHYLLNFKNIFIFSAMTFPALFAFERGNAESLLFMFLAGFLFFYTQKKYIISALFLAAAISMKLYPAVFLVLFFSDKKYKEIAICLGAVLLLSFVSLLIYKGSVFYQLHSLALALAKFKKDYINMHTFNLSYFNLYDIFQEKTHSPDWSPGKAFVRNYASLAILFFSFISLYILYIEKIFWKKIMLLVSCMLLLPYVSVDYKLLHVYLAFFMFINTKPGFLKNDLSYIIMFSLLLIPKNYYLFYGSASIAELFNISLLSLFIFSIIIQGCCQKKLDNPP